MTKIKIIIPTYNRFEKLCKLINKIQYISNYVSELVIIDNCSDDATQKIPSIKWSGLTIVYKRNNFNAGLKGNLVKSYEEAITNVQSNYVWIMSDDDELDIDIFHDIVRQLQFNKSKLYFINHSSRIDGEIIRKTAITKNINFYNNLRDVFRVDGPQFMLLGSLIYECNLLCKNQKKLKKLIANSEITLPLRFSLFFANQKITIINKPDLYINDQTEISWMSEAGLVYRKYIPKDLIFLSIHLFDVNYTIDAIIYFINKIKKIITK